MTSTAAPPIQVENYVGGAWSPAASGATIESRDPATGDLVAIAPRSGIEDVERAIAAARAAFDDGVWPTTSGRERAAILLELARLLREEMEPLARLVATEMGKPIRYVREREIEPAIDRIQFYAGAARLDPWGNDIGGRAPPPQLHAQGTRRRVRADHAMERPGRPAAAQDRRRDRDGLHVHPQAGQRCTGVLDGDLQAARADPGVAGGGRERDRG